MARREKFPRRNHSPAPQPTQADPLLSAAISHHQAGQLAEAEALYRQILQANAHHPDALHLLGLIAYQVGQYPTALQLLDESIRVRPGFADAYANRGITQHALQQFQAAVASYDQALTLKPNSPDAFNNRANSLYRQHQFQASLESADRAIALRPDFPEAHSNRGNALHALGQHQAALESYNRAIELNPNFADAYTNRGNALQALTLANPNASKIDSTGRDLVIYCGQTLEVWNPAIVGARGIGGSEEAVIWLSRLLHRRGWNVTVFANCGRQEQSYDGVTWKPYWLWNYRDKQNVTILWRYPTLAKYDINSDQVIVDLHDVIAESEFTQEFLGRIDRIFVKSAFHRSLYPGIPDEKFVIVPNGIDAAQFEAATPRDPMLLINTSSADRSLETFLDCFEQIKLQVPEAKAQWAYGWTMWDALFSAAPAMMEWKSRMQQRMLHLGVVERGRISHTEVAVLYHQANIFAYPSEMAEIDCISLSKAMAAGAIPITTDFAAMREKSNHGGVFIHSGKTKDNWTQPGQFRFDMTGPEQIDEFVREAVSLLRNPPAEQQRESMRQWARSSFEWNTVADAWNAALSGPPPHQAVLGDYDKAILLSPLRPEAHNNRGSALHGLHQYETALQSIDEAIRLKPDYADAHRNRAYTLTALKQFQPALKSFEAALQLQPHCEYLPGMRLYLKAILCDWQNHDAEVQQLESAIERGENVALPFATLALTTSPSVQRKAAEIYARDKHPTAATPLPPWPPHDRIRIGYFSSDFYDHATSYLMAGLFELHDRTQFEIIGFSLGPDPSAGDTMGRRVSAAMDRFLNVRSMSDSQIAQLSRQLEIDIAVDLKGFTHDHRAGIFAHRPAPIQVSYVGYPGTMGAPFIDYLIADPTLIPEASRQHYTEKIVYLPDSYQPNDSRRPLAEASSTRASEGLPDTAFVFGCFNNTYKITPAVFDIWMRILTRVPNSVLWLLAADAATTENLRKEAQHRGIDPDRIIFARPHPLAEHLARHSLADLFLDSSPYNAHTTASDALWTGLPVITCLGETFAGRVAASLLKAVGLPELIAPNWQHYKELAVSLAGDTARLQVLRQHLGENRTSAPLFNTSSYTRHLEAAYVAVIERHHAGLPPDHIHIHRRA
jgi:predicted O-linked N-acetylglucosamine transferase (SPINDLY family)